MPTEDIFDLVGASLDDMMKECDLFANLEKAQKLTESTRWSDTEDSILLSEHPSFDTSFDLVNTPIDEMMKVGQLFEFSFTDEKEETGDTVIVEQASLDKDQHDGDDKENICAPTDTYNKC